MGDKKKRVAQATPAPTQAKPQSPAPPVPVQPTPARKPTPSTPGPSPGATGADFTGVPAQSPEDAGGSLVPGEGYTLSPQFLPTGLDPLAPPVQLMDWSAMRAPFLTRGLRLGARDGEMIERNWIGTYNQLRFTWGLSNDIAVKLTNIGTAFAYNNSLSFTNPTLDEQFDRDLERMLPQGQSLGKIVVPILTPDTTSWIVEKISGKKIDFTF